MADSVKRGYQSSGRAAAARQTRDRIRATAADLFVQQGYVATSLRQVAQTAGVGERTVYDAFGSKASLFRNVLGVSLVGDEEPVPVVERPAMRRALSERDGQTAVDLLATYTAELFERAGDLIMVNVAAAEVDEDMRDAALAGAQATRQAFVQFAGHLEKLKCLRDDLSRREAGDLMFAIASPQVHQLLRRTCGWTAQRYRRWLTATLRSQLLRA